MTGDMHLISGFPTNADVAKAVSELMRSTAIAVAAERERCAQVALQTVLQTEGMSIGMAANKVYEAIRA